MMSPPSAGFRHAYAVQRAAEGRGYAAASQLELPYMSAGPLAKQWSVRARTYDALLSCVLRPMAAAIGRPLRLLDLGSGNGWLCWRVAGLGCKAVALDCRDDLVDGLGAARAFLERGPRFERVSASFEELPIANASFDVVTFSASLHYSLDLGRALQEACRVTRTGGRIAVLDSPFYSTEANGAAMVSEKHRDAGRRFGARAGVLLAPPFIEFLTRERLVRASAALGLVWRRHRVRYPLWYELRPVAAFLRRRRPPSRFDLWECTVA